MKTFSKEQSTALSRGPQTPLTKESAKKILAKDAELRAAYLAAQQKHAIEIFTIITARIDQKAKDDAERAELALKNSAAA